MKMWTLTTFYINNTFTDITKIVIWKISTHIEKKSTFKIIYNQSLRAVQKELLLKPRNNPWKIPIYNTLSWSRLSTIVRRHKKDRSSCSQFFIKKRLQHRFFPVNIAKFSRTAFFTDHLWWLLLERGWNFILIYKKV